MVSRSDGAVSEICVFHSKCWIRARPLPTPQTLCRGRVSSSFIPQNNSFGNYKDLLLARAMCHLRISRVEKAISDFTSAIQDSQTDFWTLLNTGESGWKEIKRYTIDSPQVAIEPR